MCKPRASPLGGYERAALLVRNATFGRRIVTGGSVWAQSVYHSFPYYFLYVLCMVGLLSLAQFEPPVRSPLVTPSVLSGIRAVDFALLLVAVGDLALQYLYHGRADFLARGWIRVKILALFCLFGNLIGTIALPDAVPYVARVLRPILLLERLSSVRRIAAKVLATLPATANVLILLVMHLVFFAVVGYVLFAGVDGTNCAVFHAASPRECSTFGPQDCMDYFGTLENSFVQLFELLTVSNFPQIALGVYACNGASMLYFAAFVSVGVYILLSMTLAASYSAFKGHMEMETAEKYRRMLGGFDLAFQELATTLTLAPRAGLAGGALDHSPLQQLSRSPSLGVASSSPRGSIVNAMLSPANTAAPSSPPRSLGLPSSNLLPRTSSKSSDSAGMGGIAMMPLGHFRGASAPSTAPIPAALPRATSAAGSSCLLVDDFVAFMATLRPDLLALAPEFPARLFHAVVSSLQPSLQLIPESPPVVDKAHQSRAAAAHPDSDASSPPSAPTAFMTLSTFRAIARHSLRIQMRRRRGGSAIESKASTMAGVLLAGGVRTTVTAAANSSSGVVVSAPNVLQQRPPQAGGNEVDAALALERGALGDPDRLRQAASLQDMNFALTSSPPVTPSGSYSQRSSGASPSGLLGGTDLGGGGLLAFPSMQSEASALSAIAEVETDVGSAEDDSDGGGGGASGGAFGKAMRLATAGANRQSVAIAGGGAVTVVGADGVVRQSSGAILSLEPPPVSAGKGSTGGVSTGLLAAELRGQGGSTSSSPLVVVVNNPASSTAQQRAAAAAISGGVAVDGISQGATTTGDASAAAPPPGGRTPQQYFSLSGSLNASRMASQRNLMGGANAPTSSSIAGVPPSSAANRFSSHAAAVRYQQRRPAACCWGVCDMRKFAAAMRISSSQRTSSSAGGVGANADGSGSIVSWSGGSGSAGGDGDAADDDANVDDSSDDDDDEVDRSKACGVPIACCPPCILSCCCAAQAPLTCCRASSRARSLLRAFMSNLFVTMAFDAMVLTSTIAAVVQLAYEVDDGSTSSNSVVLANAIILQFAMVALFVLELVLNVIARGLVKTFTKSSPLMRLDMALVVVAATGSGLFVAGAISASTHATLNFVRFSRLFRFFRLLPGFGETASAFFSILPILSHYACVLMASFYSFAIVSMSAFAWTMVPSNDAVRASSFGLSGRWIFNFDSLLQAFTTQLSLLLQNDWPIIMEGAVAARGKVARLFFFAFWAWHVVLVINVLVAFVIEALSIRVEHISSARPSSNAPASPLERQSQPLPGTKHDVLAIAIKKDGGKSFIPGFALSLQYHHSEVYDAMYLDTIKELFAADKQE